MAGNLSLLPHETAPIGAGSYAWYADGRLLPIAERWRILRARSGSVLETETDATRVPEFDHRYHAALSVDDAGRSTALALTIEKGDDTVEVSANFEADAVVVTRVVTSLAEGAVQRTQTFRMERGYTVEAHPVIFDGLHIAALDRTSSGPHRRPCLWMDLLTDDRTRLMAARPTVYVITRRLSGSRQTFAITRWGNDVEMSESLLTVKDVRGWVIPTELRFTMAGVLYSVRLSDERWED